MAVEDMISSQFRTGEEQVETARKGGIASGKARREKKDFRYFAKIVLDELVKDKKSGAELPTRYAAIKSVLKRVLKDGDYKALESLAKMADEMPNGGDGGQVINVIYNGVSKSAQEAINDL